MTNPDVQAMEEVLRSMEQLLRSTVFICIDATASPTPAQLRALQPFYPSENLLSIRKLVVAGEARIGPVVPDSAAAFAAAALGDCGLTWHPKHPSDEYVAQVGAGAV